MYYNIEESKLREKLSKYKINIEYFFFDINLVDKYFPELPNTCNGRLRYPSLSRWWITKIIPYDYFWASLLVQINYIKYHVALSF